MACSVKATYKKTTFGVSVVPPSYSVDNIVENDTFNNLVVIGTLATLLMLYILLIILAVRADKHNKEKVCRVSALHIYLIYFSQCLHYIGNPIYWFVRFSSF